MAMNTVNLDTTIADIIAKPVTHDGYVLYTRVDNKFEDINGRETLISDEGTRARSREKYNSPDNLRKLFICFDGVYVQYHKPIHGGDGTIFKEYSWGDKLGDLDARKTLVEQLGITGCNAQRLEYVCKEMQRQDISIIKGFGLGALNRPWVYQNIEEIYIDELVFTCYNKHKQGDFSTYYSGGNDGMIKYLLRITMESVGVTGLDELRNKFPRLHSIGYIHNLGDIIRANKRHINGNDEKKEDRTLSFVDKVFNVPEEKRYSQLVNNDFVLCRLYKNRSWMMNYSKKTGIYLFDSKLEEHFECLKAQYIKNNTTKQVEKPVRTEKSEYDIELLNAYELGGEALVQNVIKTGLACSYYTREQLKELLNDETYAKFKHLI